MTDTSGAPKDKPNLSPFKRANQIINAGHLGSDVSSLVSLAGSVLQKIGPKTHPAHIPWAVLDLMAYDPPTNVAEQIWAALLRNVELYYVEHDDPGIKAEAEALLEDILPDLLEVICVAFAYGMVPYVVRYGFEPLSYEVPAREDKKPFTRTKNLYQIQSVHDLHPNEIELWHKGDKLDKLVYAGTTYQPGEAFVPVWMRRFGSWQGMGSRRRAFLAWFESEHLRMWRGRFIERNVDPPRKAFAPPGTVNIDGEDVETADLMADVFMGLKGGGMATLPNALLEGSTNIRAWDVEAMNLNGKDGAEVFNMALKLASVEKFIAALVPPSAMGIDDGTFASDNIHQKMLESLLNVASNWVAARVSEPLAAAFNYNATSKQKSKNVKPPKVKARKFPQSEQKKLMEVLKLAAQAKHELERDGSTLEFTLAQLIDPVGLAHRLDVPILTPEEVATEKQAPPPMTPGRPRDALGDREERRERATTPEGEDAVGDDGEQVQE